MKKIILTCLILFVSASVAQAAKWETNFKKASAKAKQSGKHILLDFSGSDWCGWCIKLEKEVFKKSAFKKFAKENLVCVLLDFPKRKKLSKKLRKQNEALSQKYEVTGFPTIILLDSQGNYVAKTGYLEGGAKRYVAHLKELMGK